MSSLLVPASRCRWMPDGRPLYAHVMMACVGGHADLVRELLEPLPPSEVAELLAMNGWPGPSTLLMSACAAGHSDVAELLVRKGANPFDDGADEDDPGDSTRMQPLHLAAAEQALALLACMGRDWQRPWPCIRSVYLVRLGLLARIPNCSGTRSALRIPRPENPNACTLYSSRPVGTPLRTRTEPPYRVESAIRRRGLCHGWP